METKNMNILLPTDFSDNSWSAIVYALKLYANEPCTFYILNSAHLKVSAMSDMSNKIVKVMKDNAIKELLELKNLAENANANANHEFETILSLEDLKTGIQKAVEKYAIDLVVMGTKGATGAKEVFFGSNTVRIIKKMRKCPVLIIPEDYDFVKPEQIAFPTDFNRFYGQVELQPLKDLAALYNSEIRIVHINAETKLNEVQEYNISSLQSYLEDFEHSFHWMPDYSKKAVEINDFIEELKIDVLAMVNYKHSFIESIVNEPVIKTIGFSPKVPFLVIPD
ncbi:universal stress protein [Flavivirga eckloniae]|uniref:Universal stress protein n=1 Tax=Flavivirga eckloniae TaxID=1803846 RepID=A0A2K9PW89_9FLAO|nr:universal stress protein [Flavivirga eckloniae]AUP81335.1 universal stress protein [Flavivirga eckloniae]